MIFSTLCSLLLFSGCETTAPVALPVSTLALEATGYMFRYGDLQGWFLKSAGPYSKGYVWTTATISEQTKSCVFDLHQPDAITLLIQETESSVKAKQWLAKQLPTTATIQIKSLPCQSTAIHN